MGESEKNTVRQVGKKCDLSAFTVSTEHQEAFEILRSAPQELLGILPCEIQGKKAACVVLVIPEGDSGQINPLAILVDDALFDLITPLYDNNEKIDFVKERENGDNF